MKVKPKTQIERSEHTRAQLLAAARRLFGERGYGDVGTEEIVRAAGVTRGALYHHFDGKLGLFRALYEQVEIELTQRIAEHALALPDPWDQLVAGTDMFLEACTDSAVQQIVLIDGPAVLGWNEWREIGERYGLGVIKLGIQNLIDAGAIEPRPVDPLAHMLLGAIDEGALLLARAEDPEATRAAITANVRAMLEGLRA
ncbi:MAG: TetR/AcrR family transcriptional regulator [Thermoleophilaceae bacterium]|nr:TetR/AcrR family transcriptional regulator [Thermoleophilaceae bacterium]